MGAQMSEQEVTFPCGDATLAGVLAIPANAKAMVVFAHGSGSNHRSSRNADTARQLYDAGFASLRADLLTSEEAELNERTGQYRFDVAMLSERVLAASMFVGTVLAAQMLPLAPKYASGSICAASTVPTNIEAASTRSESIATSKRYWPVRSFSSASSLVSRSARNDAKPASYSCRAVSALRELR